MYKEQFVLNAKRRLFLEKSLALGAMVTSPIALSQQISDIPQTLSVAPQLVNLPNERRLKLLNVHTREKLDVVFWKDGEYVYDHIGQLNYFMRDHHHNQAARMHVRLYDSLFRLYNALETDTRIHVLSAFRTKATNEMLREKDSKVAKRRFHLRGRAGDFIVPGIDNFTIQKTARDMRLGGVGYYTKAHFVHLDTGYPRHWVMS